MKANQTIIIRNTILEAIKISFKQNEKMALILIGMAEKPDS